MKNDLDNKISAFEKTQDNARKKSGMPGDGSASRAGYELLIAVFFFGAVGYLIDVQLHTLPWFSLGLFLIGFATGVYNAWRVMATAHEKVGLRDKNTPSPRMPKA